MVYLLEMGGSFHGHVSHNQRVYEIMIDHTDPSGQVVICLVIQKRNSGWTSTGWAPCQQSMASGSGGDPTGILPTKRAMSPGKMERCWQIWEILIWEIVVVCTTTHIHILHYITTYIYIILYYIYIYCILSLIIYLINYTIIYNYIYSYI